MATKILGMEALTKLVEKIKAVTAAIPTKLSQLTNDSGYQTSSQVSTTVTNATKDLAAKTDVGTLTTLTTTAKNNLVAAINEIDEHQVQLLR